MPHRNRPTTRSFPGFYTSASEYAEDEASSPSIGAGAARGTSLHNLSFTRRSLASRVSHSIATRLSIVGLRETPREGTVVGVTINTLCNVMGAGVLALPLATRNASISLALLLLAYVAAMSAYAVYCLVAACDATGRYSVTEVTAFALFPPGSFGTFCARQSEEGGRGGVPPPHSLAPTADLTTSQFRQWRLEHAKGELRRRRWRRIITVTVETIVFCSNFGSLIIYARVIADSMPPVVGNICCELKLTPFPLLMSQVFWLGTSGVIFFVLSCAKNMEELKWSSLLGFLTIFYIVVVIVYRFYTASWSSDPEENARGFPSVDPTQRGKIHWLSFPVTALRTVSTYGVAFGYHFNVPYFYSEIRHRVPTEMMKSVGLAFPIIILSYAATGVFGYLTFGELVASAQVGGNIVMNYPNNDGLINIGRLGLFVHFACVFPIVSICARRGIHRVALILLTWSEQSALMAIEVEELQEEAQAVEEHRNPARRQHDQLQREQAEISHRDTASSSDLRDLAERTETTPLLARPPHHHLSQRDTEALGSAVGGDTSTGTGASEGAFLSPASPSPVPAAPLDAAALDRDVGSPDDTTRLAIVLEAFLLVSGSVLLAGAVSGIGLVIDVVGSLFGVFLILIVPGVVGMRIFSTDHLMDTRAAGSAGGVGGAGGGSSETLATVAAPNVHFTNGGRGEDNRPDMPGVRYARVKRWLCALSAVTGVFFTAVATIIFAVDHLPVDGTH